MLLWIPVEGEAQQAFLEEIYAKHARLMLYAAYQVVHDYSLAQDMLQESMLPLIEKIDELQKMDGCSLRGYLVSTIKNISISYWRKQEGRKKYQGELEPEQMEAIADPGPSPEELLLKKEAAQQLAELWPLLAQEDQFLLEAKYVLRHSDGQIAKALGIGPDSVRMRLTRARRRALQRMQKEGMTDEPAKR